MHVRVGAEVQPRPPPASSHPQRVVQRVDMLEAHAGLDAAGPTAASASAIDGIAAVRAAVASLTVTESSLSPHFSELDVAPEGRAEVELLRDDLDLGDALAGECQVQGRGVQVAPTVPLPLLPPPLPSPPMQASEPRSCLARLAKGRTARWTCRRWARPDWGLGRKARRLQAS
jgi:hypothetical protein